VSLLDYYADPRSGAWADVGYDPFPLGAPPADPEPTEIDTVALLDVADHYDVVIVGSGAGGGIAAHVLRAAGASVLVVERGQWIARDAPGMTHLRNHRLPVQGDGTSPDGHPRAIVDEDGRERAVEPRDLRYRNNAIAVGGGTRFFGAQAWRFHPDDFRMASKYGVPAGSALADWPISYDDLAPYYDTVEWEVGVAGDAPPSPWPRARGYPMPPFEPSIEAERLAVGARALGWSTTRVPLLVNTVPRDRRPACIRCGSCVGFPCPVDAKNGSETTVLRRAVARGAELVRGAQVVRVDDHRAVDIVADGRARTVRAGRIVLAGGAVETARLLLVSGLGNDWVGDCLQGHTYAGAFGHFDEPVVDGLGPGPSIATVDFAHDNDGVVGGGMLANDFVKLPALFLAWARPPDAPTDDDGLRHFVADWYLRTAHVMGPVQEVPTREARVRLASTVTDANGVPVARFEGVQHAADLRGARLLGRRAEEWIAAAGARRTWPSVPTVRTLSGGQHAAGTARMADSPAGGATDSMGRVWGSERVFVADGSVHVTNGCVNPVLTIMALAWRTAEAIAALG
jgi:choline dehydrogenase-like flavoprotein